VEKAYVETLHSLAPTAGKPTITLCPGILEILAILVGYTYLGKALLTLYKLSRIPYSPGLKLLISVGIKVLFP
jgi:hypothetical protein